MDAQTTGRDARGHTVTDLLERIERAEDLLGRALVYLECDRYSYDTTKAIREFLASRSDKLPQQ